MLRTDSADATNGLALTRIFWPRTWLAVALQRLILTKAGHVGQCKDCVMKHELQSLNSGTFSRYRFMVAHDVMSI